MKKYILVALAMACVSISFASAKLPNIILIYADDLGYGDVGCYGATKVKTPHIDKLAAEGRRFTDAHSPSAVCTPSRYSLLTGNYPFRANNNRGAWGPCGVESPLLINTEKETLASLLKNKGYSTACVGKWHLGFGEGGVHLNSPLRPGPLEVGFDYYFGMPVVNSSPPYVYVENDMIVGLESDDPIILLDKGVKSDFPMPKLPDGASGRVSNRFTGAKKAHELFIEEEVGDTFTEKAVTWIEENKENPFFLYFATTHIHHPFTPHKRFQGTSEIGLYGDFIHELDWMVGELIKTLEKNGLTENTLIIFTSDNGGMFNEGGQDAFAAGHFINGDLMGFKFSAWEGGHRVPFIAKWPGHIPAGSTSDELIGSVDMLSTFATLTGQTLDEKQRGDSVNVLPALLDDQHASVREHLLMTPLRPTHLGIRKGKWMFINAQDSGGFIGKKPGGHGFAGAAAASFIGRVNSDITDGTINEDAPPAQLYDMEADRNQTKNLYHQYPEVVKEMQTLLDEIVAENQAREKAHHEKKIVNKIPASPSSFSACFDFESGALAPWKVIKGEFGNPIGKRELFGVDKKELNKQGDYYLTTLETGVNGGSSDKQTGIIVSPLFIPKGGPMTFRVGGGDKSNLYISLCTEDGEEVKKAGGENGSLMIKVEWSLRKYAGNKMYLKVVDESTGGWGHITADNFQFDAEILAHYPELTK
ncbi:MULTISPECIES: arylsulfatase [unclassified Lentimonas]|uniref:sulfatase family protein n=1 Tax=unclassified Lentimonas TaxID=2630993 RepID=UPI001325A741|nr:MULTISPECIES: arylsulfatase [unclassified Lentimonas]CAA6677820.1 Choline-sulfatase (EC [Lentimonas sp. CC4]CAA6683922.1 Choline-sulfatase (EC [Lentimonas sp. CC6]CAA7076700.1 Choline-sulfatase (EC [Lentimonas sp. CC4]CAA7169966.1 Choline-sulfatase (EC [Lentimonas sp. CC21]CAA7181255.1 Choline-sulfatase (EC [Lentimonas sp. CC8]